MSKNNARVKQYIIPAVIVVILVGLSFLTRTGTDVRPS